MNYLRYLGRRAHTAWDGGWSCKVRRCGRNTEFPFRPYCVKHNWKGQNG